MKLKDFKTEQWMNAYEGRAVFNLTDTCVQPLTWDELLSMDRAHLLNDIRMDYGTIPGDIRLRQKISGMYQHRSAEEIILSQGCLQANEMVMETLLEPGDCVVAYTPGYQQFEDLPLSLGCRVISLQLKEEKDWQPDEEELEVAMKNPVKMVILNNPSNPTGTLFSDAYLQKLIQLCRKQGTWILCDEVYRSPEIPSVSDLYERGISTSSLSKLFSLAGLRLGWVTANSDLIHQLSVRRDYTIISTGPLADTLGLIALENQETLLQRSRSIVQKNQTEVRRWLDSEPRASLIFPKAGTVGFLKLNAGISSEQLAGGILDLYGVFFVPGECFDCNHHLRLGFTNDPVITAKGLSLLSSYLDIMERNSASA